MDDSLQIRPAWPADAAEAAVLLYSAYTHTPLTNSLRETPGRGWIEQLAHFFRREGNRFSYQCTQVAARGSAVVGVVLGFGGRDEARLNAAVGPWLEREAADDEWYIDALAVFQQWQHQGIGAGLLRAAEQQARQHHYAKMALHVAVGNTPALELYMHRRYVVTQQAVLYGRPHIRLVKALE